MTFARRRDTRAPHAEPDAQSEYLTDPGPAFQIVVTSGRFAVTTTADSGPGSLRQVILDSNIAAGGRITTTCHPGYRRPDDRGPLPTITNSVLIDGTSQPGSPARR
jgi:hypothetical protein